LIQGWFLEAAWSERIGVTDEDWGVIEPLLPSERGCGCRPAQDNRPYFEGMIWIARTGAQWRRLPGEYGKWNSVFRRYRRWVTTGVAVSRTGADVLVMGAYGKSRIREYLFGGVTRYFLDKQDGPSLLLAQ